LTSSYRSEVGPIGQPARQSVLDGQMATHPTYAGSRRAKMAGRESVELDKESGITDFYTNWFVAG